MVNLKCGSCQKLIAVREENLGKQLRCPHCQKVVQAPAAAPAPKPSPAPASVPSPPSPVVTAPSPPPPAVSVPASPVVSAPAPPALAVSAPALPSPVSAPSPVTVPASPSPALAPTLSFPPEQIVQVSSEEKSNSIFGEVVEELFGRAAPGLPAEGAGSALEPTLFQVPTPMPGPAPPEMSSESPLTAVSGDGASALGSVTMVDAEDAELPPLARLRTPAASKGGNRGAVIALGFLVLYCLAMCGIIAFLALDIENLPDRFDALPDVFPLTKPAMRQERFKSDISNDRTRIIEWKVTPDSALPKERIVPLGGTLTVGDLEFTAESVEQQRPVFLARNRSWQPNTAEHDSLIMHVRLKNVSSDVVFRPLETAFERRWKEGVDHPKSRPFTLLEVGDRKRFYGGTFKWPLKSDDAREFFEGQEDNEKFLYPGEEIKTVIVTDPADRVPDFLRTYEGKTLLWRVHVRRGLVRHRGRDISATTVIGVEFSTDDLKR